MPTNPQPSSSQDKAKDSRPVDKAQTPSATPSDVDIDVDQSDDETYIVHTTSTVDDKGVRHDKQHRMTTEEYAERAKKEGW